MTGSFGNLRCNSWSPAARSSRKRSTVSRATAARSTCVSSAACISSRPASSSWPTSRFIRSTSRMRPFLAELSSNPSIRARRMARGVRSSCAALLVNRRCCSKPSSIRARASLILRIRGRYFGGNAVFPQSHVGAGWLDQGCLSQKPIKRKQAAADGEGRDHQDPNEERRQNWQELGHRLVLHPCHRIGQAQVRAGDEDAKTPDRPVGYEDIASLTLSAGVLEVEFLQGVSLGRATERSRQSIRAWSPPRSPPSPDPSQRSEARVIRPFAG